MKLYTAPFAIIGALLIGLLAIRPSAGDKLTALERGANSSRAVTITLAKPQLAIGQGDFTLNIATAQPGYLTLVQRGTDGSIGVAFPNALDADNRIETSLQLPRPNWHLRASGPAGKGRLLAVVTHQPVSAVQASKLDFGNDYGVAGADYVEVTP